MTRGSKIVSGRCEKGGMVIASCGLTNTGCVRRLNEDRILVEESLSLYAVADGMGGHQHGEVAAEMALGTLDSYIRSARDQEEVTWPFGFDATLSADENRLATAIRLANRRVWERAEASLEHAGMGTTVAAVLVRGDRAAIASVGDSRVYLFRDGRLELLTVDDTWVQAMVRQGALEADQAPGHPMRSVLTQAAGAQAAVWVHTREQELEPRDLLVISSDGLHAVLDEGTMRSILEAGEGVAGNGLEPVARRLLRAVLDRGAPDNVSCILMRYGAAER